MTFGYAWSHRRRLWGHLELARKCVLYVSIEPIFAHGLIGESGYSFLKVNTT